MSDSVYVSLPSEKLRRSEGQRGQEKTERHRRCPGRSVKRGGDAFDDAEQEGGDQRAGHATESAKHADGEDAADIFAADRRLDRLDDDEQRAGHRGDCDRETEGDAFDVNRIYIIQSFSSSDATTMPLDQ